MLSSIRGFVSRHRRKFIATGVVVGGTLIVIKYAQRKIRDFQERQAREFIEGTRRMQHFEATERTCNQVIIGMSTELCNAIIKEVNTDEVLAKLRSKPENKIELWEELKILSFTRLTTFIYGTSMLIITLRIQMNVLGGYLYKDTVCEERNINDDIKQAYLSLIHYFIHDGGLCNLVALIRAKVRDILKTQSLTARLNLSDLEQLFYSIQMSINSDALDPNSKMVNYVLPQELPQYNGPFLEKMYNESLDLLESDDASTLCSNNICRGFSLAVDAIAEEIGETVKTAPEQSYNDVPSTSKQQNNNTINSTSSEIFNINSVQVALAKLIPIVSGLTSKSFDSLARPQNLATSLTSFFLVSEKIKTLGANIYEEFSS